MYDYQIKNVNSLLLKITSHMLLPYVVRESYGPLYENINPRFKQVYEGFWGETTQNFSTPEIPLENEIGEVKRVPMTISR